MSMFAYNARAWLIQYFIDSNIFHCKLFTLFYYAFPLQWLLYLSIFIAIRLACHIQSKQSGMLYPSPLMDT